MWHLHYATNLNIERVNIEQSDWTSLNACVRKVLYYSFNTLILDFSSLNYSRNFPLANGILNSLKY